MSLRSLDNNELTALQNQGCFSSDWSRIRVTDHFSPDVIRNVRFHGAVKLGSFTGGIGTHNEETRMPGLYNSTIVNCEIGNNVLIDNVHRVKNYRIGDEVVIENVNTISVTGPTSFGIGFEINVLNEGGGREILVYDRLSAQLAYMMVCYRHDRGFITAINKMIKEHAVQRISDMGHIGAGTKLLNSGSIFNVNFGENALVRGASLLKDGTIVSNNAAPVFIGENVVAKNFIILSGSSVDGGALIDKSFIGQSVIIGKQFSAENCVFFANSEAFHGEAVSVFAGPYTVSHHKSTLMIAGMFSFFNAGSGSNQSNHMYKLGPVHQGILERGSKTGSFSYMLWPCHTGAYNTVMGKNTANFDTSQFPFSYITVEHEKSYLYPGLNFITAGTRRDCEKWPGRDRRTDPQKTDLIHFDFLNPCIIERVIKGRKILEELRERTSPKQESAFYKGIRIKRTMIKPALKYYEMALSIFIGNQVIKKLEEIGDIDSIQSVREKFSPGNNNIPEKWIDMAGMIAPDNAVQKLIGDIETGSMKDLEEVSSRLIIIYALYETYAWDWTANILSELYDIETSKIEVRQLIDLVTKWESDFIELDKMILSDAKKEYNNHSRISYGIDGNDEVVNRDFEAVRGIPEENSFAIGLQKEMEQIKDRAGNMKSILNNI